MPETETTAAKGEAKRGRNGETAETTAAQERRAFSGETGAGAVGAAGGTVEAVAELPSRLAEASQAGVGTLTDAWRGAFEPMLSMQMDMTRWFDAFWRETAGISPPSLKGLPLLAGFGAAPLFGAPPADIREGENAYLINVELPGLKPQEIDLRVRSGSLTLSAEKSDRQEAASGPYRVSERRFGRIERSFALPTDADAGKVKADFKDGVLKITVPRAASRDGEETKVQIGA